MAIGGVETPLARGEHGIEQAMADATAVSMGIVGAEQPTASTRGRVDVPAPTDPAAKGSAAGMGLDMGIESPEYGWHVTPQDMGQASVANIATPTGPVPVAQQMLPFGAIAARQQATAERKAALAEAQKKAAMAFDPFKGISDPADPYQTTFNQYIRDEYTRKRQEMADASFGGDTAAFDKWVIEKPEGQMWLRTNFTMPMDAIAKENKGRVQAVADFLVEASEMQWDIAPEDYKQLQEYTTLINDIGAPLSGVDSRELMLKGRAAERVMSKVRFQKEFLKGFAEYAQQMPQEISFSRPAGAGGKIVMQVKDEGVFNDYIDAMADSAAEARMFGRNKEAAKEWLRKLIKDKYDVKVSTFDPYESVERREAAKARAEGAPTGPMTTTSVVSKPSPQGGQSESVLITPWQVTQGKPHKINKGQFNSTRGSIDLYAPSLTWDDKGLFFIEGRDLSASDVAKVKEDAKKWAEDKGLPSDVGGTTGLEVDIIMERNIGKPSLVAASNNAGEMKVMFGSSDPYEVVAMQLQEKGFGDANAAFIKKNWSDPKFRTFVMNKLK